MTKHEKLATESFLSRHFHAARVAVHRASEYLASGFGSVITKNVIYGPGEANFSMMPPLDLNLFKDQIGSGSITEDEVVALRAHVLRAHLNILNEHRDGIRDKLASIVDTELAASLQHAAKDIGNTIAGSATRTPRLAVIADLAQHGHEKLFMDDVKDSVNRLTAAKLASNSRQPYTRAELEAFVPKYLTQWRDPANAPTTLQSSRLTSEYAALLLDAYMNPKADTARAHARILHEEANRIRKELGGLMHRLVDEGGQSLQRTGLLDKTFGTKSVDERFVARVNQAFDDSRKRIRKDHGIETIGLDAEQQGLQDHMLSNYAKSVFRASGHVASANSTLALINAALLPTGYGASASSAIRAMTGIGLSALAQYDSSPHVMNSSGQRRIPNPDLPSPNYSAVAKQLKKISYKEIAAKVNRVLANDQLESATLDGRIQDMAQETARRTEFARQIFNSNADAQRFLQNHAGTFDRLVALKNDLLTEQKRSASAGEVERSSLIQKEIDRLTGVHSHIGISEVSDTERFSGMVSFLYHHRDANERAEVPSAIPSEIAEAISAKFFPGRTRNNVKETVESTSLRGPGARAHAAGREDLLSERVHAKQVLYESSDFLKTLNAIGSEYFTDLPADQALAAVRRAVYTNTIGALGTSLLAAGATTAAAAPFSGPAAVAVGAATQYATMVVANKAARTLTHHVHKNANNTAAVSGTLAKLVKPEAAMLSETEISDGIVNNFPKFSKQWSTQLDRLIAKTANDELAKIAENRYQIGRQLILDVFRDESDLTNRFLAFDSANTKLAYHAQLKHDLSSTRSAIDRTNDLITHFDAGGASSVADASRSDSNALHVALTRKRAIRKVVDRYTKAENGIAENQRLVGDGVALVDSFFALAAKRKNAIDANDFANIRAGFLYPAADSSISGQLEQHRDIVGKPSDFPLTVSLHESAKKEVERFQGKVETLERDVKELVEDHAHYKKGDTNKVQDRFGIYRRWHQDYYSSQLEFERRATPSGVSEMRVGARLAGAVPQLLATSVGVAIGPNLSLDHFGDPSAKPTLSDKFLQTEVQTTLNSANIGALATFSSGGNANSLVKPIEPRYAKMIMDLGLQAIPLEETATKEVLGGAAGQADKRDGIRTEHVQHYPIETYHRIPKFSGSHRKRIGLPDASRNDLAARNEAFVGVKLRQSVSNLTRGMTDTFEATKLAHQDNSASLKTIAAASRLVSHQINTIVDRVPEVVTSPLSQTTASTTAKQSPNANSSSAPVGKEPFKNEVGSAGSPASRTSSSSEGTSGNSDIVSHSLPPLPSVAVTPSLPAASLQPNSATSRELQPTPVPSVTGDQTGLSPISPSAVLAGQPVSSNVGRSGNDFRGASPASTPLPWSAVPPSFSGAPIPADPTNQSRPTTTPGSGAPGRLQTSHFPVPAVESSVLPTSSNAEGNGHIPIQSGSPGAPLPYTTLTDSKGPAVRL
ncbi:hypothetical protein [Cupriavidus necator]